MRESSQCALRGQQRGSGSALLPRDGSVQGVEGAAAAAGRRHAGAKATMMSHHMPCQGCAQASVGEQRQAALAGGRKAASCRGRRGQ